MCLVHKITENIPTFNINIREEFQALSYVEYFLCL